MSNPQYSFVIPVFNRPKEIEELLDSFTSLNGNIPFEILIIEDGSEVKSDEVVKTFQNKLNIRYFEKANSGPGDSRNFGMQQAVADYFIILDSDVLLDSNFLVAVDQSLKQNHIDFFGGPDGAIDSFTNVQRAINYSMTSFWTTGGIRGHKSAKAFQPRSFNMGISRKAFIASGGFGKIHPGEDPDLVLRLWKMGFNSTFIEEAVVYHKRRINWNLFSKQVFKFGSVRPILDKWHPNYKKLVFWFPSLFMIGLVVAIIGAYIQTPYLLYLYAGYFVLIFIDALLKNNNVPIALMAMLSVLIQFLAYGYGFIRSKIYLKLYPNTPEPKLFPNLFFE